MFADCRTTWTAEDVCEILYGQPLPLRCHRREQDSAPVLAGAALRKPRSDGDVWDVCGVEWSGKGENRNVVPDAEVGVRRDRGRDACVQRDGGFAEGTRHSVGSNWDEDVRSVASGGPRLRTSIPRRLHRPPVDDFSCIPPTDIVFVLCELKRGAGSIRTKKPGPSLDGEEKEHFVFVLLPPRVPLAGEMAYNSQLDCRSGLLLKNITVLLIVAPTLS
ncbi:hypothetical protein HMN09_01138800 [Mycena chlorophos]|uniref:Uncharacterized protein n=1 Tax=Mycena chlorophos TaxID=658473 RepID=A0A8H6VU69_MYCCL|nr:hypothetical protein HMN09_01138800 [Mycena chlorophos]